MEFSQTITVGSIFPYFDSRKPRNRHHSGEEVYQATPTSVSESTTDDLSDKANLLARNATNP